MSRRSFLMAAVFQLARKISPFFIILCSTSSPSVNITRHFLPTGNSAVPLRPLAVTTSLPVSNCRITRCGGRMSTSTCLTVSGTALYRPPVQSTQTHCWPRNASVTCLTEGGSVADQKLVCRPPPTVVSPPCSTISSSWLPKPSSIMRSTSSRTRCLTASSFMTPRCRRSMRRPGVATMMSAPCASSRSCDLRLLAPKSATARSDEYSVKAAASCWTCSASSRVGTSTSATGRAGPFHGSRDLMFGMPTTHVGGTSCRRTSPVASSNSRATKPSMRPRTLASVGLRLCTLSLDLKWAATIVPGFSLDRRSADIRMGRR
mmetsp:Transcript_719/g.2295  ORF Transcript_719/g.2295 Transcript_719/m.2295 type:complete len:318 (-) Transcript_719:902-1855(-)